MSKPKLGFLGVGWIGRHRMEKMLETGAVEAVAICDPSPDMVREAAPLAPDAAIVPQLDDMLALGLDGVVIASPSALHAEQSIRALERGVAVFCQKPLGRNADEARAVIAAARQADRLLGVDLSYRETEGMQRIKALLSEGALGDVFAVDLTFHNAYGPDKPWFYDRTLSGGGCLIDLGVHMLDLALWALDFPEVADVRGQLFSGGGPLKTDGAVEDYAVATVTLQNGAVLRLACSWNLHAGRDAEIAAHFHGTQGGATFRNVGGSFYDFVAELNRGTQPTQLCAPPDDWGGRAAANWARALALDRCFDEGAARLVTLSETLDRIAQSSLAPN